MLSTMTAPEGRLLRAGLMGIALWRTWPLWSHEAHPTLGGYAQQAGREELG